jgi:nitrogen PTS system EIIA component
MLLQDLFPPDRIKLNLESSDKDEAFEELVDVFVRSTGLDVREEALRAIRDREAKMSTGIKHGIAIPHGQTRAVEGTFGVLGISVKGIDYEALDGDPVYLLFLIVSPEKNTEEHLRLLKRLTILLDNPQFYQDLSQAQEPGAVSGMIRKYENMLMSRE